MKNHVNRNIFFQKLVCRGSGVPPFDRGIRGLIVVFTSVGLVSCGMGNTTKQEEIEGTSSGLQGETVVELSEAETGVPHPSETEKMAMGRVFYTWAKVMVLQAQVNGVALESGQEGVAQLLSGMVGARGLSSIDTTGCPQDFADAWSAFATSFGLLQTCQESYNMIATRSQQALQTGLNVNAEDVSTLEKLKEGLETLRDETNRKMNVFISVCQRYGTDNLQKWSIEAFQRLEGNPDAILLQSERKKDKVYPAEEAGRFLPFSKAKKTIPELVSSGRLLSPEIKGCILDPKTMKFFEVDGERLPLAAQMWNARVDYSLSKTEPSGPHTRYFDMLSGKTAIPSYFHHEFNVKTGKFYRADRKPLNAFAEGWNEKMDSEGGVIPDTPSGCSSRVNRYDALMEGLLTPIEIKGATLNPETGMYYRDDGRYLGAEAELWNAKMAYSASKKDADCPVDMYDELMMGRLILPSFPDHEFNGNTGLFSRPDGLVLSPDAALWNVQMSKVSAKKHSLSAKPENKDPTMLDEVVAGHIPLPSFYRHEFDMKTGEFYRTDGRPLDSQAALWNARMRYSINRRKESSPPTRYDEIISGALRVPVINNHYFDGETGKFFRPAGKPLETAAALWNARMEYSVSGRTASNPPSLFDQVVSGDVLIPSIKDHYFDEETGRLYRIDGKPLSPQAVVWNKRMTGAPKPETENPSTRSSIERSETESKNREPKFQRIYVTPYKAGRPNESFVPIRSSVSAPQNANSD